MTTGVLEPGGDAVTRRILAVSRSTAERLARRGTERVLRSSPALRRARLIRLPDLLGPVWAGLCFELVFRRPPSSGWLAVALPPARAEPDRAALVRALRAEIGNGFPHPLPAGQPTAELAGQLADTFFTAGVRELSAAGEHLFTVLAADPVAQERVLHDEELLDALIEETFRLHPVFAAAGPFSAGGVLPGNGSTLREGTVLCFNDPVFHRVGYQHPDRFDHSRWAPVTSRAARPVALELDETRPCSAWRFAPLAMRVTVLQTLRHCTLRGPASAPARSAAHRGPCLVLPRTAAGGRHPGRLSYAWLRDRQGALTDGAARLGARLRGAPVASLLPGADLAWPGRREQG